ncbi:hypothetical protein [Daejeonella lutea]|uniref:Uncharacterized protein n=1 Tax=Daejeonella lutea TaxID=572036 RepID=A0A1T5AYX4_9SPHI|nr:hypothetical protein [Daejeonella lutea]SKB40029.1 hypothetical protein SAMN05661099_1132 [Daejeonella lutea]
MELRKKRILFYVLGGILLGFICLSIIIAFFPVSFIDLKFSEEVQEHQYPVLDFIMKGISWPGSLPESIVMVLAIALILTLTGLKREVYLRY